MDKNICGLDSCDGCMFKFNCNGQMKEELKVGDKVKGKDDFYAVTNTNMLLGEVIRINKDNTIDIKIKVCKNYSYAFEDRVFAGLDKKHFEKIK